MRWSMLASVLNRKWGSTCACIAAIRASTTWRLRASDSAVCRAWAALVLGRDPALVDQLDQEREGDHGHGQRGQEIAQMDAPGLRDRLMLSMVVERAGALLVKATSSRKRSAWSSSDSTCRARRAARRCRSTPPRPGKEGRRGRAAADAGLAAALGLLDWLARISKPASFLASLPARSSMSSLPLPATGPLPRTR